MRSAKFSRVHCFLLELVNSVLIYIYYCCKKQCLFLYYVPACLLGPSWYQAQPAEDIQFVDPFILEWGQLYWPHTGSVCLGVVPCCGSRKKEVHSCWVDTVLWILSSWLAYRSQYHWPHDAQGQQRWVRIVWSDYYSINVLCLVKLLRPQLYLWLPYKT